MTSTFTKPKTVQSNIFSKIILRGTIIAIAISLSNCASIFAKKQTYSSSGPSVKINGADVRMQVSPQGSSNGDFTLSAMVVSTTVATMQGPFKWRIEAVGATGKYDSITLHRIQTTTEKTKKKEWYPSSRLGQKATFRRILETPEQARARYEIPGMLRVTSLEDGGLSFLADISVRGNGRTERKWVKFKLNPTHKKQNETVFLPAEIIESIGKDWKDMDDPNWD